MAEWIVMAVKWQYSMTVDGDGNSVVVVLVVMAEWGRGWFW